MSGCRDEEDVWLLLIQFRGKVLVPRHPLLPIR